MNLSMLGNGTLIGLFFNGSREKFSLSFCIGRYGQYLPYWRFGQYQKLFILCRPKYRPVSVDFWDIGKKWCTGLESFFANSPIPFPFLSFLAVDSFPFLSCLCLSLIPFLSQLLNLYWRRGKGWRPLVATCKLSLSLDRDSGKGTDLSLPEEKMKQP